MVNFPNDLHVFQKHFHLVVSLSKAISALAFSCLLHFLQLTSCLHLHMYMPSVRERLEIISDIILFLNRPVSVIREAAVEWPVSKTWGFAVPFPHFQKDSLSSNWSRPVCVCVGLCLSVAVCDPDVLSLPSRRCRGERLHQQNWTTAKAQNRFLELKIPTRRPTDAYVYAQTYMFVLGGLEVSQGFCHFTV